MKEKLTIIKVGGKIVEEEASLHKLLTDFAAIDFETANGRRTSVCSVGIVVVRGGAVVDTYYSLIRPRPNFYSRFTTAEIEQLATGPVTGRIAR